MPSPAGRVAGAGPDIAPKGSTVAVMDDTEIRAVVTRLCRPHRSGGVVVERAAILAAGGDYRAVMDWILDHDGVAEVVPPAAPRGGLHGARVGYRTESEPGEPGRYIIPAGVLD